MTSETSTRFNLILPDDLKEQVEQLLEQERARTHQPLSVAWFVREAVREKIERMGAAADDLRN